MNFGQELLKEEYLKRKSKNDYFSLRSFARWLGTSPAQLSQMMSGKRSISVKSIHKISQKLNLSPAEKKRWLHASVQSSESPSLSKENKKTLLLQEDSFRLIADWYHFAILGLSRLQNAQSDPRWVARQLGISVEEAHQALLRLVRMKVIQTKPQLKQIVEPLEVMSEIPSEAIRKYHKQNLNLAAEKIEMVPNQFREYQSISLVLNPNQIKSFKKLIDQFLEDAADMQKAEPSNQSVYNLNVQLFPISKLADKAIQEKK